MSTAGLKTFSYRNSLRQSLEKTGWRDCPWAPYVLAVECVQGWAGRKNPEAATMLHVYCTTDLRPHQIKKIAKFFSWLGLPPFNFIPIRGYRQEVASNRLPKVDTQDRFWLLRGYSSLDSSHWDHWLLTQSYWGIHFVPEAEDAMRIIQDPILFDSMLTQDWNRQQYSGEASVWAELVAKYHTQWQDYSAVVQMLSSLQMSTAADFRSIHLSMRSNYLNPTPLETFDLP